MRTGIRNLLKGDGSVSWLQALPAAPPVDRRELVVVAARGKRVIHLGFTDEHLTESKEREGRWLHAALSSVATELVGLDLDQSGVEEAKRQGYEAYVVDLQDVAAVASLALEPAQLVVAGEIIEHLQSPGQFLQAVKPLLADDGRLIVTTPNAYRTLNFLAPLLGGELIHPDHVGLHSIHTLRTLGLRGGYGVEQIGYYQNSPIISGRGPAAMSVKAVRAIQERLLRRWPHWSDGIFAVFSLSDSG